MARVKFFSVIRGRGQSTGLAAHKLKVICSSVCSPRTLLKTTEVTGKIKDIEQIRLKVEEQANGDK
jgi:hypothetical protein